MNDNILLPIEHLNKVNLHPAHQDYLSKWLHNFYENIELEIVCSSDCIQALFSEICLNGRPKSDFIEIMDTFLALDNTPIAYSRKYGNLLHNYDRQWIQSPIHSIFTRFSMELILDSIDSSKFDYCNIIEEYIQPSGWIYNPKVSNTVLPRRMITELLMSLAMGSSILKYYNRLNQFKAKFESLLSSLPLTPYVSSEYFRAFSLSQMDSQNLFPADIEHILQKCHINMGFSDFSLDSKIDEYMGTNNRIQRDNTISSPLISLYAFNILELSKKQINIDFHEILHKYGCHLRKDPLDIPAFRMRDIDIPFGSDITPLEAISASHIISYCESK